MNPIRDYSNRIRHRRRFLSESALGFGSLALSAMLAKDGIVRANDEGWKPPMATTL